MEFTVVVYKSFGPFIFKFDNYKQAIDEVKRHWFSPGVWNINLFVDGECLDISEIIHSWGDRPIYC